MIARDVARAAVARAVRSGQIPPASAMKCESCRAPACDWHHHNGYANHHRLDVTALCRECHSGVHNGLIPEPRTGRVHQPQALPRNMRSPGSMVIAVACGQAPGVTRYQDHWDWARAWVAAHPPPPFGGDAWMAWMRAADELPGWDEVLATPSPAPAEVGR